MQIGSSRSGGMADALDSKSSEVTLVWVRVPPSVLVKVIHQRSQERQTPVSPGFFRFHATPPWSAVTWHRFLSEKPSAKRNTRVSQRIARNRTDQKRKLRQVGALQRFQTGRATSECGDLSPLSLGAAISETQHETVAENRQKENQSKRKAPTRGSTPKGNMCPRLLQNP